MNSTQTASSVDVVVIGGGAAGLNAALMLGRSLRSVLVVDGGQPRNAPAHAVHGLFAREGVPPRELLATGRDEVRSYGGSVVDGTVESVIRIDAQVNADLVLEDVEDAVVARSALS